MHSAFSVTPNDEFINITSPCGHVSGTSKLSVYVSISDKRILWSPYVDFENRNTVVIMLVDKYHIAGMTAADKCRTLYSVNVRKSVLPRVRDKRVRELFLRLQQLLIRVGSRRVKSGCLFVEVCSWNASRSKYLDLFSFQLVQLQNVIE